MKKHALAAVAFAALFGGRAVVQSASPLSNTELPKESENPVSPIIRLPLLYEAEFDDGAYKATKDTVEIDQALVPFRLNEDWSLITRTKLPAEALPPSKVGSSWASGLSNGYTTFFLSPEHGHGFYWGIGPVPYYPASSTTVGVDKWGSGPSVAFFSKDPPSFIRGSASE